MTIVTASVPRDGMSGAPDVRVVAVPAGHPYVRRVTDAAGIEVLPDPPVPGAAEGVWWPPVALDPDWIRRNADDADILHVHFGTESFPAGHLTACVEAAHAAGWAVVFTVHDLTHPQLTDQSPYAAQLDELVPRADALVTLTPGAAAEVRERWGRDAAVLPHPAILHEGESPSIVAVSEDLRIGMHLKDLRPGTDGPTSARTLIAAVERLRDEGHHAVAEIRMHRSVRDQGARDEVRAAVAGHPYAVLVEQGRLPDAALNTALGGLDVCVLPYRFGSHSGWLELCWDLGVPVAVPDVGHFADQHDDASTASFRPGDIETLTAALRSLLSCDDAARPGSIARAELTERRRARRREQDAATAEAHAALYRRLRSERVS
ncbi:glycosyltransferase [Microbacterium sp. AISO3]|uniref:glycosyltransferase n=1 Tax=Microbacterium sp. AISO3 TaxID=2002831 RepID=UPI001F5B3BB9|nr:glycosyltransferase [Microbacterium sp. AISO3]